MDTSVVNDNNITLNKIKDIICSKVSKKAFVNYIFFPLKNENMMNFTDSYNVVDKHLSEFMDGNRNKKNGKLQSVATLKEWADKISNKKVYQELLEKISIYSMLDNEQLNAISELFHSDKSKMPNLFSKFIEHKITDGAYDVVIFFLILWSVYGSEYISLFSEFYANPTTTIYENNPKLVSHMVSVSPVFIGREYILKSIDEKISSGNHFVFLQGIGGIGKSECAKQYAKKYSYKYHTIIFAKCTESIMKLLNDNTVFTFTSPLPLERVRYLDDTYETETEFYKRKLSYLRATVDEKTLIILDNVDNNDPCLSDFLTGICHVIITTRWQYSSIYPNETIHIKELGNMKELKNIFSAYYQKDISSDKYIENIIRHFSGHTLILELVARQMRVSCVSSKEMWNILREKKEDTLSECFYLLCYSKVELNMINYMKQIFDISSLNSTEVYILSCLSLFSQNGIEKRLFKKLCNLQNYTDINNLVLKSWIFENNDNLSMHTLIKETVHIVTKPDLHNFREFVNILMKEYTDFQCYYAAYETKTVIIDIISSIYNVFPEPIIDFCDFYEWIELVSCHCMQYEKASELAHKLYNLYREYYGDNHFKTVRMYCRIACNKRDIHRLTDGLSDLEKGREMLQQLDKTDEVLQYIADVDMLVGERYLEKYEDTQNNSFIDISENLYKEIIFIRTSLREKANCSDEKYRQLNCVAAYSWLACIMVYKKDFKTAKKYIDIATKEYNTSKLDYLSVFITNAKIKLSLAKTNENRAKILLKHKQEKEECYFGKGNMQQK